MKFKEKLLRFLKTALRNGFFLFSWLAPLFVFTVWHIKYFEPIIDVVKSGPYVWLLSGVLWWVLCWLCVFALNLIWPVLMLIFFKTERLKNPRQIIQIGDRFRKLNLSAPQTYKLVDSNQFWKNTIRGFFAIPSPFGALVLISPPVIEKLSFEELDAWICRQVLESRFYRWSRPGITFFTWIPTAAFFGYFCGQIFFQNYNALITATFFVLVSFIFWIQYQRRRILFVDFRTIRTFKLNPDVFFQALELTYTRTIADKFLSIFGKPTIEIRKQWYNSEANKVESDTPLPAVQPLHFEFLKPALPITLTIATSILMDNQYRQKINGNDFILALGQNRRMISLATKTPVIPPPISVEQPTQPVLEKTNKLPASAEQGNELSRAIEVGDMRKVIQLLGQGTSIHMPDPYFGGATPLLLSLKKGDLEMVFLLLSIGAKLEETDFEGKGSLFYALESNQKLDAVNYVIRGKVDLNKMLSNGKTALDIANENAWADVAKALEAAGAKTSQQLSEEKPNNDNTSGLDKTSSNQ